MNDLDLTLRHARRSITAIDVEMRRLAKRRDSLTRLVAELEKDRPVRTRTRTRSEWPPSHAKVMDALTAYYKAGHVFTAADAVQRAGGIPGGTVRSVLSNAYRLGRIERVSHGKYRIPGKLEAVGQ